MEFQITITAAELEIIKDAVSHYGFETDTIFSNNPENDTAVCVQSILEKLKEQNPNFILPWEYY